MQKTYIVILSNTLLIVKKINKKSFTTKQGATIYENGLEDCFILTEEEARASVVHKYNQELKELNENLKSLEKNKDIISLFTTKYPMDTEVIEEKINGILDKIKEKLENDQQESITYFNGKSKEIKRWLEID